MKTNNFHLPPHSPGIQSPFNSSILFHPKKWISTSASDVLLEIASGDMPGGNIVERKYFKRMLAHHFRAATIHTLNSLRSSVPVQIASFEDRSAIVFRDTDKRSCRVALVPLKVNDKPLLVKFPKNPFGITRTRIGLGKQGIFLITEGSEQTAPFNMQNIPSWEKKEAQDAAIEQLLYEAEWWLENAPEPSRDRPLYTMPFNTYTPPEKRIALKEAIDMGLAAAQSDPSCREMFESGSLHLEIRSPTPRSDGSVSPFTVDILNSNTIHREQIRTIRKFVRRAIQADPRIIPKDFVAQTIRKGRKASLPVSHIPSASASSHHEVIEALMKLQQLEDTCR